MSQIIDSIGFFIVGAIASGILFWFIARQHSRVSSLMKQQELATEKVAAETIASRVPALEEELAATRKKLEESQTINTELETRLNEQQKSIKEKLALLENAKETLSTEFQNLGQKIFDEKSEKFTKQNQDNFQSLMKPFQQQITDFQKRVNEVYHTDTQDRTALREQLINLQKLNQQLSLDAINLTRALKGDSKVQGNWGEVILEKILEQSGLSEGREYEKQEALRSEEGGRYYPDVIIHLPEDKDIVIDSKVSLTAYERYVNSDDDVERVAALAEHVTSVRNHVRGLSLKNYDQLQGLRTLGYILMFIPVEPAFFLAVKEEPELFSPLMNQNIFIVGPSNLMLALRTIHAMWQYEYQNRNAEEIAKQAGGLYDKLVGFVESLDQVGERVNQARESWEKARGQLISGRGNLIKRAEDIKQLGVRTKKDLPINLIEAADDE